MSHAATPPRDPAPCHRCDQLKLLVSALESQLAKLRHQLAESQTGKTGGPEENAEYSVKKLSDHELHRLKIAQILQRHLTTHQSLPLEIRREALKLLADACVIFDEEDLSDASLHSLYVQYVLPDLA